MNTEEVRVHTVKHAAKRCPAFVLYSWPLMAIHEPSTRYLSEVAKKSSVTHQRNIAYALSHWLSYCLASGVDFRRATRDDVERYIAASEDVTSELTGQKLSEGTIGQRVSAIARYHEFGARDGWNLTAVDLAHALASLEYDANTKGPHPSITHARPIDCTVSEIAPRQSGESDVRALNLMDLTSLLDTLGPSHQQLAAGDQRPNRDRLIAEWLVYVGLRVSEALCPEGPYGLDVRNIVSLKPSPQYPFDHIDLKILGKGNKLREVAVPNWLALKTIRYVEGERARATSHAKRSTGKLFVAGENSHPKDRGHPITVRAFQKALATAAVNAGLYDLIEDKRECAGNRLPRKVPKHSPHDLRHTYAVMTYYAQRALGNSEPWKPIQAQLGHRHLSTTINTYLTHVTISGQWGQKPGKRI
jgi:integrase